MQTYLRDSTAPNAFCRGFENDSISLALLMIIDIMAQHVDTNGGIPCNPPAYLPGLLGITQRKWTQTIEPALVQAKKIRAVTKNGIKVWVFADEYMAGPRALFRPVTALKWEHRFLDAMMDGAPAEPTMQELRAKGRERLQSTHDRMHREARPNGPTEIEREASGRPDLPYIKAPDVHNDLMKAMDAAKDDVARVTGISEMGGISTDPLPYWEHQTEELQPVPPKIEDIAPPKMPFSKVEDTTPVPAVPSHSAYEVLKQAGIEVDDHPRGEFFWLRNEHNEHLNTWLETVPINEIVVRLDKARLSGKLPDVANTLVAYDRIVLGEKK